MGLKKLEEIDISLRVKLTWTWKIFNGEGIWAEWATEKYVNEHSFWELTMRNDDSRV